MFRHFRFFLFVCILFFYNWNVQAQTQTVLGPKRYFVGSLSGVKVHTESISRSAEQIMSPYKLILKNGDGQAHTIESCSGLNLLARLWCQVQNAADQVYIAVFRVSSAEVRLNGVPLTTASTFNSSTAVTELQIGLQESNTLQIELHGGLLASVEVTLQALSDTQPDQTPPSILTSHPNGAITQDTSAHVSITDQSNVVTEIYKDGVLIATQNVKEFDIPLSEGLNNFVLKARDQHGNQTDDFFWAVTSDTIAAAITLDSPIRYAVPSLPATFSLRFLSDEVLQSFTVDGVAVSHEPEADRVFIAEKTVDTAGAVSVNMEATDLAGNIIQVQFPLEVVVDNSPPNIELGEFPTYTNLDGVGIPVVVTDDNEVATEIQINGEYFTTVHTNNFTYWFELLNDGPTHISFIATDAAGNSHSRHVTVVRDTGPLLMTVQSPVANTVYTSLSVAVQFSANRQLTEAYVNDIPVPLSPDGQSVQYLYTSPFDGPFTVNIRAIDLFGHEILEQIPATIQLGGNALWTYSECPAE